MTYMDVSFTVLLHRLSVHAQTNEASKDSAEDSVDMPEACARKRTLEAESSNSRKRKK
jgi:hypothetical protein